MSKPCLDDSCDARIHCSICGCHMLGSFPEYGFSAVSVCSSCDGLDEDAAEIIRADVRKRWNELYHPKGGVR